MASTLGSTMKAVTWTSVSGGFHKNLKVDSSAPLPKNAKELPADHTLVKVAYASINPADIKLPEAAVIGRLMFFKGIPALDFAGTVVESKLPHLKPGEPVFGMLEMPKFGSCAEYLVAPKASCVPVPNSVKLEDAATIGIAGLTAYQTFMPFVKPGAKVFFNGGSGGVGTFQIQLAKAYGCHVTTSCSGPNVELCKSLGADEVIDYRTEDVLSTLTRKGQQFDLIVDNVFADASLYWACHNYLKPESPFITISGSPTYSSIKNILSAFLWPRLLGGGQRDFKFVACNPNPQDYEEIAKLMNEGKVKPIIEQIYSLEDTGKAYERLRTGRTRGKLVIKVA